MATPFIIELRAEAAEDKLAAHGLTQDVVIEVWLGSPRFFRDKVVGRTMMIGPDFGGALVTVIIEPTNADGVWLVVTGWSSSRGETTRWRQAR